MARNVISVKIKADPKFADISKVIDDTKHIKYDMVMKDLRKLYTKKEQKDLVAKIGNRYYDDINAMRMAELFTPVQLTGKLGRALEAIRFVIIETYNEALRYKDTGLHSNSFYTYQGTVGGRDTAIRSAAELKDLGRDSVYTVINITAYAAILEAKIPTGIMYAVYLRTKRKFGPSISIKYDYTDARNYSTTARGGYLPRIQIAGPGRIRTSGQKPGTAAKRNRAKGKTYSQVKGRSAR